MRLYLEYRDGSVQVPPGDTIIGRNVDCSLRFNDPYVSRRHLRIHFGEGQAWVEEIASRNGTLLNGRPMRGREPLTHGDTLRLGRRVLSVVVVHGDPDPEAEETTRPQGIAELTASVMEIENAMQALGPSPSPSTMPAPAPERSCPSCRKRVRVVDGRCEACGLRLRYAPSLSTTQRIDLDSLSAELEPTHERDSDPDRRADLRRPLEVPVVYTSETLTIDATTQDLSRGGVFIASTLLDEVGTRCHVTLLPEAAPAIPISSSVARVVTRGESGMGIRFETPSERARLWLETVLDRGA